MIGLILLLSLHGVAAAAAVFSSSHRRANSCFVRPPAGDFASAAAAAGNDVPLRNCGRHEAWSPALHGRRKLHSPVHSATVDDDTASSVVAADSSTSRKGLVDEDDETGDEEELTLTSLLIDEESASDANGNSTGGSGLDDELSHLQKGKPEGFYVVRQFSVPEGGFDLAAADGYAFDEKDVVRLGLTADNVTATVALMLLDPETFPSFSKARKACRKGNILIHRGPLGVDETTGEEAAVVFDPDRCRKGVVGTRVYPGDVVAQQVRMGGSFYPNSGTYGDAPFDLPVVYEDDYFAIVNKPAGVVVYSHRKGGHGRMTVRSACPFALRPPRTGTEWILRRPQPVHRLDKPTSGLLLVAKTKPALIDLSRQFVERKVKKSYTAIVNGIPFEDSATSISSEEARDLNVDVSPEEDEEEGARWQIIDHALEEKSALTVWRSRRYAKSLKATDGMLTLVELKPKTGRYHQLRRHMAWVCDRPLVGDATYAGGSRETKTWGGRGLFLCSNEVALEHPYYNTEAGRREWDSIESQEEKYGGGMLSLSEDGRIVEVRASIDLPKKFSSLLDHEQRRAEKFANDDSTA